MPGAVISNGSRVDVRRLHRLAPLLLVAALLTAVPLGGTAAASGTARDDRHAALDRAHTFALADAAATNPQTQERRDVPVGALPALAVAALIALAGTIVARTRRRASTKARVAFRRRAPPLLRTPF